MTDRTDLPELDEQSRAFREMLPHEATTDAELRLLEDAGELRRASGPPLKTPDEYDAEGWDKDRGDVVRGENEAV